MPNIIALGNLIDRNDNNLLLKAKQKLKGVTFSTASAGNHGLSLAAGARLFGAKSIIYVSKNVPRKFIGQLEALGAKVSIIGDTYDESLQAAIHDSKKNNWTLISDSTLSDVPTEMYPEIEKKFFEIVKLIGYPEIKLGDKIDFKEQFKKNQK